MFNKYKKYEGGVLGREIPDPRDYQLSSIQEDSPLPKSFDLRSQMEPTTTQNWGSCCASSTAVQEFFDGVDLSRKFTYYNMKKISGFYNMQGDFVRNALKAIVKYGVCLEETFPDIRRLTWKKYLEDIPSQEAYTEALEHRGGSFWAVGTSPEEYKQAIWQQKAPVVFSMRWAKSYSKPKNGVLPLPDVWKTGHCVVAVGWTEDALIVRNSFGKSWGDKGHFYIPFKDWDKHEIWNAYILLDRAPTKGWVALKFLESLPMDRFIKGQEVAPTSNLNIRTEPMGEKIKTLQKGTKCAIMSDEVINRQGYQWQQVKVL